jgi:hypothetical protein
MLSSRMKAVFTTPTIMPRSTAQTIPGSQTLRLVNPARKAGRLTEGGSRTTDSVAAGAAVAGHAGEDLAAGVVAVGGEAAAGVAIFRGVEVNPTAIASVAVPPIRMARRDSIRGPNAKGRLF